MPDSFDIEMYDDGEMEGYNLINPEGVDYFSYRVAKTFSPGYYELLAEAEHRAREVEARRSVLEEEAARVYKRG